MLGDYLWSNHIMLAFISSFLIIPCTIINIFVVISLFLINFIFIILLQVFIFKLPFNDVSILIYAFILDILFIVSLILSYMLHKLPITFFFHFPTSSFYISPLTYVSTFFLALFTLLLYNHMDQMGWIYYSINYSYHNLNHHHIINFCVIYYILNCNRHLLRINRRMGTFLEKWRDISKFLIYWNKF